MWCDATLESISFKEEKEHLYFKMFSNSCSTVFKAYPTVPSSGDDPFKTAQSQQPQQ
jgi:hypothetical protein